VRGSNKGRAPIYPHRWPRLRVARRLRKTVSRSHWVKAPYS